MRSDSDASFSDTPVFDVSDVQAVTLVTREREAQAAGVGCTAS